MNADLADASGHLTGAATPSALPAGVEPGRPAPLGAHARDGGVNVAVWSDHARRIEVCVFDATGVRELRRYGLHGPDDGVFHGFLPGLGAGLVYGLRAHGPYAPEHGHRFNPNKLLLDPWAREIVGCPRWHVEDHGYEVGNPEGTRSFDRRDNAAGALKARVSTPRSVTAGRPPRPRPPAATRVLCEAHVKALTMTHPALPAPLRGTYAGLAHPAIVDHLRRIGVTTLSLLPVAYALDEPGLAALGMHNHWGYNTLGFFCPTPRYARAAPDGTWADPADVADEFRAMVDALHAAGLEVVLDVVFNHTPEGDETGHTLSWRGLDHASWYRLVPGDPARCENLTGCGNTLNVAHPRVTQFVLDALRHWVADFGVDGFRFDLAPVLGRTAHGFDPQAAFFTALRQDPLLADVLLVAEPWDAGYDGYQLGRFPGRFLEWNDRFRDSARRYWLGQGVSRGEFARRFTASSDLFHHGARRPTASVNFVTAHDGFTLVDLTSYARKHNEANGESNRDGRDGEPCASFGPEGPTHVPAVRALRRRVQRALTATLLFAQGTPMLAAGDEIGRTQRGNNNAYNQDNPLGWLDWATADDDMAAFVARCAALRRARPALHHDRWFAGPGGAAGETAVTWIAPEGRELTATDWHHAEETAFAGQITPPDGGARTLLLFNPQPMAQPFHLPARRWSLVLDSSGECPEGPLPPDRPLRVPPHALLLLDEVPA